MGYRGWDWASWQDGGMEWLQADREAESGCKGLEGDELRDAMLAKDDGELGWALGLSREISAVPIREIVQSERIRCKQLGLHSPEWTRVDIYDAEREVFVAIGDAGIRVAPLKVAWEDPSIPTRLIELGPVVP